MLKSLLLSVLLLVSIPAFAKDKVEVSVKGMVCSFCANGVEKKFGAREEVEKVDVDLDNKMVTIIFKDGKSIDDETVKKLITEAGFNVDSLKKLKI